MENFFASEGYVIIFDFPSKTFCLTVPRISVGKPCSVSLVSCAGKVWIRERGVYQDFLSKFFCLTVPKNFIGEPFCAVFQKNIGSEKVSA